MVSTVLLLFFLTGFYPIGCAIRANRKTTLVHALCWALGAWLAWTVVVCFDALQTESEAIFLRYFALGLTGCASIAVLGARRPEAGAWNFVILGLLGVVVFLWFEGWLTQDDMILHRVRTIFLASTVSIGVLNYLPTRLAPAAMLLAFGCGLEILGVAGSESLAADLELAHPTSLLMVILVPWVTYSLMRRRPAARVEFDQIWLRFRDSFGFFWAQRLREQFNQSAHNAEWPVVLRWPGLRVSPGAPPPSPAIRGAMKVNLRSLMKRFEAPEKTI